MVEIILLSSFKHVYPYTYNLTDLTFRIVRNCKITK